MGYVVFRKNTNGSISKLSTHRSERGAKISLAAAQKREDSVMGPNALALREVSERVYRTHIVRDILVRDMLSGEVYSIPGDTEMTPAEAPDITNTVAKRARQSAHQ